MSGNAEQERLQAAKNNDVPWRKWGPYLSERQWGTVREDYSENGDAWNFFTHDQARSRAYRWGEDGIAGISDDKQRLCFALALWNGKDPILKERLFGLTNSEGNHGEDVKEYYFYLDSTPTHSYMKMPLQVPPGGVPLRRPGDDEPRAQPGGDGVRAARHRRLRRRPLLRRLRGVRQGRPGRHPREDHRVQPRAGGGRAAPAADALVPQRLGVVDRRVQPVPREAEPQAGQGGGGHERGRGEAPAARRVHLLLRRRRAAALHRQHDEQRPALPRAAEREPVLQGRHQRLRGAGPPGRGEPGEAGHQGRGALPAGGGTRAVGDGAAAPQPLKPPSPPLPKGGKGEGAGRLRSGRSSTRPSRRGCRRRTSSTAP